MSKQPKRLSVIVQKLGDGRDYIQIMSENMTDVNVNIVLTADEIILQDVRK